MTDRAHALLSASGAKKWIACPRSAREEDQFPDQGSEFATEGTLAHELCEKVLLQYRDGPVPVTLDHFDLEKYTAEMIDGAKLYLQTIRDIVEPLKAAGVPYTILVEQRLDFSEWVPDGFGTGDCVIVTKDRVWVIDFKFGKGIEVVVEDNPQLKLYGLGAWTELAFAYEGIENVTLMVVQPRKGGVTSDDVSLANLLAWGDEIKPRALQAFNGEGEFCPGSHCTEGFCKARFTCRARAEANLKAATEEFGDLPKLTQLTRDETAALLPRLDEIAKWAKELSEWALKQAVDHGVQFPGFKLVAGRSNRYITDEMTARIRLTANGLKEEEFMTEPKLLGITALEKACGGAKDFQCLLGDLVGKPPGKPVLVPESDKRPVWSAKASADEDFGD